MNKQIELVKLKVKELELQLQIQQLAVSMNFNSNSFSRTLTSSVQFIQFDNKINNYKKEVTFKNSRLTFKLKEIHNYNV